MSDYTKATNFTLKDGLTTGDPQKIIKGSEIDAEYSAISNAITSKADLNSPTFTGSPEAPKPTPSTDSSNKLATTSFVQGALQGAYPVGSIYMNATVATNPATLLGFGQWQAFGAGRVPVGIDASNANFDTAEETGGSADAVVVSHGHTTDTQGSHRHTQSTGRVGAVPGDPYIIGYLNTSTAGGFNGTASMTTDYQGSHSHTVSNSGESGTNKNLQPYIVVYMWKRTA